MRKPKLQNSVLKFLTDNPLSSAVAIQRGIGMSKGKGNIYTTLKHLITKGHIVKEGTLYRLSATYEKSLSIIKSINKLKPAIKPVDERMPFLRGHNQPKPPPAPNPLIAVYSREIQFVEDGIDSLMITKNYLQRRVEQLKQEDARRA